MGIDASVATGSLSFSVPAPIPTSILQRFLEVSTPIITLIVGATLTPLVTLRGRSIGTSSS